MVREIKCVTMQNRIIYLLRAFHQMMKMIDLARIG